jgi:hypothetical protein
LIKIKDIEEGILERELLIDPTYRKIDKHGRIYFGVDMGNTEVLVILLKPKPEDKIKWLRVK